MEEDDEKISLDQCSLKLLKKQYPYTGHVVLPQIELTYMGNPLQKDIHYTLTSDSFKPGQATAVITGLEPFSGSQTVNYEIITPR